MTAPAILSTVLSSFILLGVVGIVLVFWYWSTVGRWVSDVAVKVATTAVKYLGVLSSVGGAYAAAHRDDWFIPAIAGATCAFLWDALEKLIDHRVKATDKIDKQTLALAEKEGETRTELLTRMHAALAHAKAQVATVG